MGITGYTGTAYIVIIYDGDYGYTDNRLLVTTPMITRIIFHMTILIKRDYFVCFMSEVDGYESRDLVTVCTDNTCISMVFKSFQILEQYNINYVVGIFPYARRVIKLCITIALVYMVYKFI